MHNKITLSVCIPTYNRSKYLQTNLRSIFEEDLSDLPIEVLVSDNCSTDNTQAVIQPFLKYPQLKAIQQSENVGAVNNVLDLVKRASGDFCWVIGDDDFILQGALRTIIALIKQYPDVQYFYATMQIMLLETYEKYPSSFSTGQLKRVDLQDISSQRLIFEELISPQYSRVHLGELMASIFKRERWLQHDLKAAEGYLETLENTFPHSVIFAHTFFGQPALYIKTPLIIALEGVREWWDKYAYILIVQVRNLLNLYYKCGLPLHIQVECDKAYLKSTFPYFMNFMLGKNTVYRNRIDVNQYMKYMRTYPMHSIVVITGYILKKISDGVRKLVK